MPRHKLHVLEKNSLKLYIRIILTELMLAKAENV